MFRQKTPQAVSLGVELKIAVVIMPTRPNSGVETRPKGTAIDNLGISRRRRDGLLEELSKVRQQALVHPVTEETLLGRIKCDACYSRWSGHAWKSLCFPWKRLKSMLMPDPKTFTRAH